ncbi:threonine-phosphate decarboxylase CobD [Gloeobacter violaceus]|uniref:threonine-phosphate decarboxylase n=1 Tax=Gloeobacter violaceus (strain ATCC 29082 / PCC 7421) TaxID=251221 RepID=Q7NFV1_GLOVI|nr:threonine-phosphate decarboxylase CobD [Gloeobacter violaceus]BAC91364.1 histidinol-phosphate aminotransferase [Gloeobacter violaceus PCC 7421]
MIQTPLPAHGGDRQWAARIARCRIEELVDFSASINPLGPPPGVQAAYGEGFADLLHYPAPHGSDLQSALAARLGIEPERIVCGNGAAELLTWAGRECARAGRTVLPIPAFGDYRRALAAFDAPYISVPLAADFSLPKTLPPGDAVMLANPHNPSGYLYSPTALAALFDRFKLLIFDEAFIDFLDDPAAFSALCGPAHPGLIVIRSLTKFYSLPGLRLGYAVLPVAMAARWQAWRDPWPVNALAQHLGVAALADLDFERRTRAWLGPARSRLAAGLALLPGLTVLPGAANFLLVQSAASAVHLQAELLRRHRLLIRHCTSYDGLGERYFRVAVRGESENDLLTGALAEILAKTPATSRVDGCASSPPPSTDPVHPE